MQENKLIRSETFSGTVEQFRALMQRFAIRHAKGWVSARGDRLVLSEYRQTKRELVAVLPTGRREYKDVDITPPTRGSWEVNLLGENIEGYAGIEAYQESEGQTKIEFWDGYYPGFPGLGYPPIGAAFEEFCRMVVGEIQSLTGAGKAAPLLEEKRQNAGWKPWEKVPDYNWDRQAVELWWKGYTAGKIAKYIGISEQRVRNRLTELRKRYGPDVVPRKSDIRKKLKSGGLV